MQHKDLERLYELRCASIPADEFMEIIGEEE